MLSVGMEIKLIDEHEGNIYRTRVAELDGRDIQIEIPIAVRTGKDHLFRKGTGFEVVFIGEDGVLYEYQTRLMARKRGNVPLLVIGAPNPKSVKRIQRRENVRVLDSLKVSLSTVDNVISAVAKDISAGGMAIRMRRTANLHSGDEVMCTFSLPFATPEMMKLKAEVVRCTEGEGFTYISLKFKNMSFIEEKQIRKYVFSRQIDLRKKGVI